MLHAAPVGGAPEGEGWTKSSKLRGLSGLEDASKSFGVVSKSLAHASKSLADASESFEDGRGPSMMPSRVFKVAPVAPSCLQVDATNEPDLNRIAVGWAVEFPGACAAGRTRYPLKSGRLNFRVPVLLGTHGGRNCVGSVRSKL